MRVVIVNPRVGDSVRLADQHTLTSGDTTTYGECYRRGALRKQGEYEGCFFLDGKGVKVGSKVRGVCGPLYR